MTSAKALSSKAGRFAFMVFAAIALASAPSFVFAQHGGGHGGGGGAHGGGGGVHSAGRSSGSSGRSTGGGPSAGSSAARSYRAAPSAPSYSRPSSSYARRSGNAYRSGPANAYRATAGNRGTAYAGGGASGANASRVAPSDGQWHSFRPSDSAQASDSSRSTNAGTTRTFVGQGHDLYEESPRTGGTSAAAHPATTGSASRTVSGSLGASSPAASAFASRGQLAGNASFGARTFAARGIEGAAPGIAGAARFGFGWRPVAPLFPRPGFGFGFGLRPGFGFGIGLGPVFRPGFGFGRFGLGFGFGFGWNPCWGAVWDDPFCFGGFAGPAYDDYGYPPYDPNAYPPQSFGPDPNYDPGNQSGGPAPDSQSSAPSEPVNPNWDTTVNAGIATKPGSVIIYLRDGTSLSPSDYWITDDQLHYTLAGSESTVGLDHVDLRRTNDENARNGVRFWLKSDPEKSPAASGDAPAASPTPEPNGDAAPGLASTPPAPAPNDARSAEPL